MLEPFDPDRVRGRRAAPASAPPGPLTVSQVTALIKDAIEQHVPSTLTVVGQISNCKRHSSGHLYLTLKDAFSELACVMWRSEAAKLKFKVGDGLEVIATGAVEVFERSGRYQLYIRKLEPRGVGALELAYRQLCDKLRAEGLFEPGRKKPLPRYPATIALVTSPTGAAVADMLRTLCRRFACVHVLLFPVRVQGPGAAAEIAAAVRKLNEQRDRLGGIDLIIVARGGGSLEDLWAFNEEPVARAVFASRIPIISGVGHETDVTICDLVADLRAPTPTAAAELAVPDVRELLAAVGTASDRALRAAAGRVRLQESRLRGLLHRRVLAEPVTLVRHRAQAIDETTHRMQRCIARRLSGLRRRVDRAEALVQRIAPHTYLWQTGIRLRDLTDRLRWGMHRRAEKCRSQCAARALRLNRAAVSVRLPRATQQVERLAYLIPGALDHRMALSRAKLAALTALLGAVSHQSVLARGYTITRLKRERVLLRSAGQVGDRQRILTEFVDGEIESETVNVYQLELFDGE